MPKSRRSYSALRSALIVLTACFALSGTATALAAGPASVSVQVEGRTQTLLPPTTVTTTTAPVVKDGNSADSCTGTSAAGALELATAGHWGGTWNAGLGYSVESIDGENYAFDPSSNANYYWGFWIDDKSSEKGICETELNPGDSVLFIVECYGSECPPPSNPLGLTAPTSASVGTPVIVTVSSFHNPDGASSPAAGATINAHATNGASASASTDSAGHATLTFTHSGTYTLSATAPGSVRTEATICVHAGNDGSCGTTAPTTSTPAGAGATAQQPYTGAYAVVAKAAGINEGHIYPHGHGPRTLTGSVLAHTGLASVSIELRRSYHGRCFAYEGTRERFVKAACGHGSFFKVASSSSFSYLLPAALAPGRYVLDIQATDAVGNRTTLARGSTRTVFYVR